MNRRLSLLCVLVLAVLLVAPVGGQQARLGYYRFPALWHDTIVFTAEGDLWRVAVTGGVAQRLTSHPAQETRPAISPDGKTVAYSAAYEGPTEVYTLPLEGGVPVRQTYDGGSALVDTAAGHGRVVLDLPVVPGPDHARAIRAKHANRVTRKAILAITCPRAGPGARSQR
jgi:tricorn protease